MEGGPDAQLAVSCGASVCRTVAAGRPTRGRARPTQPAGAPPSARTAAAPVRHRPCSPRKYKPPDLPSRSPAQVGFSTAQPIGTWNQLSHCARRRTNRRPARSIQAGSAGRVVAPGVIGRRGSRLVLLGRTAGNSQIIDEPVIWPPRTRPAGTGFQLSDGTVTPSYAMAMTQPPVRRLLRAPANPCPSPQDKPPNRASRSPGEPTLRPRASEWNAHPPRAARRAAKRRRAPSAERRAPNAERRRAPRAERRAPNADERRRAPIGARHARAKPARPIDSWRAAPTDRLGASLVLAQNSRRIPGHATSPDWSLRSILNHEDLLAGMSVMRTAVRAAAADHP